MSLFAQNLSFKLIKVDTLLDTFLVCKLVYPDAVHADYAIFDSTDIW